jgi:uncharacterized protein YndB with AHSA1/START domain
MTELIERDLTIPRSLAEVWEAVTDPAWLETWLADAVTLELWPGGEAHFVTDGEERTGWVEEVSPPSENATAPGPARLAFWWAIGDEPATRVQIELTPDGSGTAVRLVESRPLQVLDLVGIPLPGQSGRRYGPALVAA